MEKQHEFGLNKKFTNGAPYMAAWNLFVLYNEETKVVKVTSPMRLSSNRS